MAVDLILSVVVGPDGKVWPSSARPTPEQCWSNLATGRVGGNLRQPIAMLREEGFRVIRCRL